MFKKPSMMMLLASMIASANNPMTVNEPILRGYHGSGYFSPKRKKAGKWRRNPFNKIR